MSEINVGISNNIGRLIDLEKQMTFATSEALTETARQAQTEVIETIQKTFTTRNAWYLPRNKFGIRIEAANKTSLKAAVKTDAYWLALHETGGVKEPRSAKELAIPTANVRRSKRENILKSQLPRNLKNAFILQMQSGPALFIRQKTRGLRRLYNLEPKVKIKKESTVVEPTLRIFKERFAKIFAEKIGHAFRTAK
jgi:hypothetical protein